MRLPITDINGEEYQKILCAREMYYRYGPRYAEVIWAEDTLMRLEARDVWLGYDAKDRKDFVRVKEILSRMHKFDEKYNPRQPRVPAGHSDGGQWTDSGGVGIPVRKPGRVAMPTPKPAFPKKPKHPHPYADSPYYDPELDIYDPPINPTWSPFDFIGAPAKPAATVVGRVAKPVVTEAVHEARHLYNIAKLNYIRRNIRSLKVTGKGTDGLSAQQMQSLKRIAKRNPSMKEKIEITKYSDGSAVARFDKPANEIPNSYARYEKHIGKDGKAEYMIKITHAPDGKIVHIHPKNP